MDIVKEKSLFVAQNLNKSVRQLTNDLNVSKSFVETYRRKLKVYGCVFPTSYKQFVNMSKDDQENIKENNRRAHSDMIAELFIYHATYQLNKARIKWLHLVAWVKDALALMSEEIRVKVLDILGEQDYVKTTESFMKLINKCRNLLNKEIRLNSVWNLDSLNRVEQDLLSMKPRMNDKEFMTYFMATGF
jgi:hypothetical protein